MVEATGGLETPWVSALAAAKLPVVVMNPRLVRGFAKATSRVAQTDRIDAEVLAHDGEVMRSSLRPLPDADTQQWHAWVTRRRQRVDRITAAQSRLSSAPARGRDSIVHPMSGLRQQLASLDDDLDERLKASPLWHERDAI